jgi:hypothetical protein
VILAGIRFDILSDSPKKRKITLSKGCSLSECGVSDPLNASPNENDYRAGSIEKFYRAVYK